MIPEHVRQLIIENHYTRSVPSGKTHAFEFGSAVVLFSIPANCNISPWLLGERNAVWELSRLWAPDGHAANLLTQAVADAVARFRQLEPAVAALISYADPNAGHNGGVYRAASWTPLGQSEEGRFYQAADGTVLSRRAFHSGRKGMTKAQILERGYEESKRPGKYRFARGLTKKARRAIAAKAASLA